jgi:xanthine/uracil permease
MVVAACLFPGFWSRIAVFLALIFGYLVSWLFDAVFGMINSCGGLGCEPAEHDRVSWTNVDKADWIGFPSGTLSDGVSVVHGPSISLTFVLLVLPAALVWAEQGFELGGVPLPDRARRWRRTSPAA